MIKYGDYSSEVIGMLQDFAAGDYTHYTLQTLYEEELITAREGEASITDEGRRLLSTYENRELD